MALLHANDQNFNDIIATDKPILLDFFATWCGPCRMIAPFIEEIADEHPEYAVVKIDVDDAPALAQAFGIESIPTLVVMKDGQVVRTAMGARPKADILALIEG